MSMGLIVASILTIIAVIALIFPPKRNTKYDELIYRQIFEEDETIDDLFYQPEDEVN